MALKSLQIRAGVDAEIAEFELGPNPYRVGNERLSVGIFYEGGSSEEYRLNPPDRDLQVFILDPNDPEGTLTVDITGTDDRSEGRSADRFTFRYDWFGCQVIYQDGPENLSAWKTLFVSLKSSDKSATDFEITMNGKAVSAATYGFVNDGNWYHLAIPTQDFDVDLTSVDRPFGLNGKNLVVGETLIVDDLYFTKWSKPPAQK